MYPPAANIAKELPKGGMVMSGYQIPEYSQLMVHQLELYLYMYLFFQLTASLVLQ